MSLQAELCSSEFFYMVNLYLQHHCSFFDSIPGLPRESAVPGGEVAVGERFRSAHHHPDGRLPPQQQQKMGKEELAPSA